MISRWCLKAPYELYREQPFSSCLLDDGAGADLTRARMFLPEAEDPSGPLETPAAKQEAGQVWQALCDWFAPGVRSRRAALLRFHRFVPGYAYPVVSHWTTANSLSAGLLHLHDASAERNALFTLEEQALMPQHKGRALLRIVPESLLFLER